MAKKKVVHRPWSELEVEFLRTNTELSYLGVAEKLGRTRGSVKRKAEALRKPENPNKKPGARPGEAHHKAKLTEELVREMRAKYAQGDTSHFKIWEEYLDVVDVGLNAVSNVLMNKTWRHVV